MPWTDVDLNVLLISLMLLIVIESNVKAQPIGSAPTQPALNVGDTILGNTTWFCTATYNVINSIGVGGGYFTTIFNNRRMA